MPFSISIPQFVTGDAFDADGLRRYMTRAEALGFEGAWTLEQVIGTMPVLGPLELLAFAAACSSTGPVVPARLSPADLAALTPGVHPRTDWWLACRDCGRWYRFLGKHVAAAHRVSPADYRARHQLPPDLPLHAQVRPSEVAGAPREGSRSGPWTLGFERSA